MAKSDLTAKRLRELLDYDPATGVMTWRNRPQKNGQPWARSGKPAGNVNTDGYRHIFLSAYGSLSVSRLAWLHATGTWPTHQIDHINGVVDDNRIANLRDVSIMDNLHNQRRAHKQNKSGFLGVTTMKGGYVASIQVARKRIYLGWFKTPNAAHAAYIDAKRRLHRTCDI